MTTSTWRRMSLAVCIVVLGLAAGILFSDSNTTIASDANGSAGPSGSIERRLTLDFPNPLGSGESIAPEDAVDAIEKCADCVSLPADGLASVANVKEAWSRSGDEAIALDFDGGLRLYVFPDDRNGDEWAKEVVNADGSDLAGPLGMKLIDLRGTSAVGIEMSKTGPAALSWIEDALMFELLGKGGQDLETLISVAESFKGSNVATAP